MIGLSVALALVVLANAPSLAGWVVEAESPDARVTGRGGVIDVDTPKGLTLWRREAVSAPVVIAFEAMAVAEGGANDRVSDLNAFWMARNADGSPVTDKRRGGAFAEYDDLRTYYVGIGGNGNTTTRLRRYVGTPGDRPLLPEHDRRDAAALLVPNRWTRIRLIADFRTVAVDRDGRRLFTLSDPHPYTRGHWGLRTTSSHLRIRRLTVTRR